MVEYFPIHKCSNKLFNTLQFVLGIKVDNTFPKQYVDVKKLILHEKTILLAKELETKDSIQAGYLVNSSRHTLFD